MVNPILTEYNRLINLGYKKINLLGPLLEPLILILLLENKIKSEFTNHIIESIRYSHQEIVLYLTPI